MAHPEGLAPDGNTVFPEISRGLIVSCERAENTKGPIVENLTYRTRLAVGLLLAPLSGVMALYVLGVMFRPSSVSAMTFDWLPRALWLIAITAYLAEFVLALPAHLVLFRHRIQSLPAYCILGAAVGATPFAIAAIVVLVTSVQRVGFDADTFFWITWAGIGAVYGLLSAVTFWLIAVRTAFDGEK